MTEFEMIAKTFQGLEEILAKELIELGANNVSIGNRMVSFTGDKALLYKANFHLRTAIRVLKPFQHFKADTADEVYEICKRVEWEKYMTLSNSFAVDAVVNSEDFKHSKFVAYRVKDAIADYFREKFGKRPNVSVTNPDLTFHIHISHDDCSLSLDSSGESLHRRGYRQDTMEAPLNEVLAAGMIMISGWDGKCDFVDPMCGSGTIAIEAALIAKNMAPGLFRTQYAFEKWKDFDKELFESIYNDDSGERPFEYNIYAYDVDPKAIQVARRNAKAAGLLDQINFKVQDFKNFEPIKGKTVMVTNPPYGERIKPDDLLGLYEMIGERLKHAFQGGEAWIISYLFECFEKIGLKPSTKIPLFNGALPCELRKYEIFAGRYNKFREEGSELDKSEVVSRRSSTLKHKARQAEKLQNEEEEQTSFRKDGDRPFRKDGDRPFRKDGERSFHKEGDRPFRKEGERSFRKEGDRPFRKDREISFRKEGDRSFRKEGDRPFRKDGDRPFRKEGERPFRKDGDRPFRKEGDRPFRKEGDRPFRKEGDRPFRKEGDRPFRKEGDRPFRKEGEKSFHKEGDRPFRKEGERSFHKEGDRPFRKEGERQFNTRSFSGPRLGEHKPTGKIRNRNNNKKD